MEYQIRTLAKKTNVPYSRIVAELEEITITQICPNYDFDAICEKILKEQKDRGLMTL